MGGEPSIVWLSAEREGWRGSAGVLVCVGCLRAARTSARLGRSLLRCAGSSRSRHDPAVLSRVAGLLGARPAGRPPGTPADGQVRLARPARTGWTGSG